MSGSDSANAFNRVFQNISFGQVQVHYCLCIDQSLFISKLTQLRKFIGGYGYRFFAKDVFTAFKHQLALRVMQGVRACDVNRVNIAFCKFVYILINCCPAEFIGKGPARFVFTRIYCREFKLVFKLCSFNKFLGYPAGSDYSEFNHLFCLLFCCNVYYTAS